MFDRRGDVAGSDAHRARQQAQLRARLSTLRTELAVQRDRLASRIEACRQTTEHLRASIDNGAPSLFTHGVVELGGVEIHLARQTIRHAGGVHRVTPTEWQLLTFLLAHPSVVHSRLELAAGAWGPGFAERNSEVEVYVSRLRRKLGPASARLETVRGRGYRLLVDAWDEPLVSLVETDGTTSSVPAAAASQA
jgi:DNA-binding response OmpR family regulator